MRYLKTLHNRECKLKIYNVKNIKHRLLTKSYEQRYPNVIDQTANEASSTRERNLEGFGKIQEESVVDRTAEKEARVTGSSPVLS